MKKVSLFLVWVFCACMGLHAASYGILINGSTYYEGTLNSNAQNSDFTEYMALGIPVSDGDQLQLYDKENATGWVVALDAYSTSSITLSGEHYVCSATGCYDFYIKLKYDADLLYIGEATGDCSGNKGEQIGGGGSDPENPNEPNPDEPNPDEPNPDEPFSPTTPDLPQDCASAVPSQCGDVMLQAFYWDSNGGGTFGDTKWSTLQGQTSEINAYFDMVWLPPSAKSSGGVGYHPAQYCNQNSAWGSRAEL
ncbi:MAG: hypothetical protein SPE88_02475, partial [Paludibacteraceae bacterium]|nr:hypothetical protein [Paludibacteraceae bacterium]